jgi:hypothetical protein
LVGNAAMALQTTLAVESYLAQRNMEDTKNQQFPLEKDRE